MSNPTGSVFQATIGELQDALATGALTSVDLVARYLRRINIYDQRGPGLNAIPILNTSVFEEAAASDDRRAAGKVQGPLDGIPYTVKDSFKVKGMTVAAGSPAFQHLMANEDAHTVSVIRKAGGVLIGRTNMPPMAEGGMQPGVYGRAESPYNPNYLSAAYGSGSSNGGGVAVAASFSAFGLGEETFSSGRSPASNNSLVAYTPSRGVISIRGNWPLYPTHDVVVPFTTTVDDMLTLLDTITMKDPETAGDFWREQPFVKLPKLDRDGVALFEELKSSPILLRGIRIAVPESYLGKPSPGANDIATSQAVVDLWNEARGDLEALGAEIVVVPDLPVVTEYESFTKRPADAPVMPPNWNAELVRVAMAHYWDRFLRLNHDPKIPDLSAVNPSTIWPWSLRTPTEMRWNEKESLGTGEYDDFMQIIQERALFEVPGIGDMLHGLEAQRTRTLDDWLALNNCDFAVIPAAGDVGPADADVNDESYAYCRKNGIWFSSGNAAFRHLGVPTVSVTMGMIPGKEMPMSLTFLSRAYDDIHLLKLANAYEKQSKKRVPPRWTPELETDKFQLGTPNSPRPARPTLIVNYCTAAQVDDPSMQRIEVEGQVEITGPNSGQNTPLVAITVHGFDLPPSHITLVAAPSNSDGVSQSFRFKGWAIVPKPIVRDVRFRTMAPVDRDKTMVVVLARAASEGYPSGWLGLV